MIPTPINAENLIAQLLIAFPEIEDSYQDELRSWDGKSPGNYNFVAFVLKPYVKKELDRGKITDFLKRFGQTIETICASGDLEAINVIWLKIFKLLLGQPAYLWLIWPILGPLTRANIEDAARRWDVLTNLPTAK